MIRWLLGVPPLMGSAAVRRQLLESGLLSDGQAELKAATAKDTSTCALTCAGGSSGGSSDADGSATDSSGGSFMASDHEDEAALRRGRREVAAQLRIDSQEDEDGPANLTFFGWDG